MDAAASSMRSIFHEINENNDRSNQEFSFATYVPPYVTKRVRFVDEAVIPTVYAPPCQLAMQIHPDYLDGFKFSWFLEIAAREAQMQFPGEFPRDPYSYKIQFDYDMPVAGYGDRMQRLSIARNGATWYASDYHFENSCIRWWHRQGCKAVRSKGYYWFNFKYIRRDFGENFKKAEEAKKTRLDYSWY